MPLTRGPKATLASHASTRGPLARFERRARARARCRGSSAAIAGATGQARTRELVRSTRRNKANHKQAAPLLLGHRRRARQQWRGGGGVRATAKGACRRCSELGRGESGQEEAAAHHEATGAVGEVGGSPETEESATNSDRCIYGKSMMAIQRRRSAKRGSAWM